MAAKKKVSSKQVVSKAAKASKTVSKAGKKVSKAAKTLLDVVAQKSAQLLLDSGLLGKAPKTGAKKAKKKAPTKRAKKA